MTANLNGYQGRIRFRLNRQWEKLLYYKQNEGEKNLVRYGIKMEEINMGIILQNTPQNFVAFQPVLICAAYRNR